MHAYWHLNKQFIDGAWIDGSEEDHLDVLNPFDDSVITTFKCAGTSDVDRAFEGVQWVSLQMKERAYPF